MQPFEFELRTRVIFGNGRIGELGRVAAELGGRRVLVVSDKGIVAAGIVEHGVESLRKAGLEAFLFDAVEENPTTRHVDACVEFARENRIDLIVGLGGGSSMDCAKGSNFLLSCGGKMADYWGVGKATMPMLPLIAVPTTAGTGSEMQSFALIGDAETHQKMACGDKKAACRVAILDAELTVSQPPQVTAMTGMDAIAHALETCVTKRRNAISDVFSQQAWRLLERAFPRVLADPTDLEARADMLLGACFAGMAIENSMLGATHACANPLTAHHGIPHGGAISLMLPHVVRFNGVEVGSLYEQLLRTAGLSDGTSRNAAEQLADRVIALRAAAGLPGKLGDCGVTAEELPGLAAEAARQWTAGFNPRPVGESDLLELYRCAL